MGTNALRLICNLLLFSTFVGDGFNARAAETSTLKAFPTAQGYGRVATGWRSGKVIHVTNLLDAGPGSLRACVEDLDPRICVFDVSGTIYVDSPMNVRPNVYVAGQTSPGGGIQIRLGMAQSTPLIVKNSHDVVLRFLKFRPGQSSRPSATVSGLLIENSQKVIVDHCSIQFATDQNFTVHFHNSSTSDVTLQKSIVGWGLDRANHPKGRHHSKGALICSGAGKGECGRVSMLENLFAHNRDRNPDISGTDLGPIELVNNVFYNPISQFGEFYDRYTSTTIRYINNLGIFGPSTKKKEVPLVETYDTSSVYKVSVEAVGNMILRKNSDIQKPAEIKLAEGSTIVTGASYDDFATIIPTADLLDRILSQVGPGGGRPTALDALDAALLNSVRQRKGRVIDHPADVGGWPQIEEAKSPEDSDQDGMSDEWEDSKPGLDKHNGSDSWADRNNDGWSNIEEYLGYLAND